MTPEMFQKLADALPGIIYVMTADASRYLYMNPPIERILGYPSERFLSDGPQFTLSLMHPEDLARVMKFHRERVEQLNGLNEQAQDSYTHFDEYRLRHRDGGYRWIRSSGIVYERDSDGAIKSVLGVGQDITEQKELEARMRISERMASVGRLAAGMAHEINNPLAHLIGSLEITTERLSSMGTGELSAALDGMHQSANRIARLVRDLRVFSRPEDEEKLIAVSLERALESSIPLVMNEIRHRARLVRAYEKVPLVLANEARLSQVFLNLLTNAAQAIPDGKADENEITLRIFSDPSGRVVTEVQDTGVGIEPENLKNIFDPFFTTKPVGQGTGLGLAICFHIVQSLGGELQIESLPGKGSTFRMILPKASATAEVATQPHPGSLEVPVAAGARGRILLVDDDPMVAEILYAALSEEHEVVVLTDMRECVKLVLDSPMDHFDLIFCDLIMPQMSGMEFYEEIRKLRPGLEERFIFMTGGAFTQQSEEFLQKAPNQVLHKPFRIHAVRALARRFVESLRAQRSASYHP